MPDSNPIKTRKTSSKRKRKESTKQAKRVLLKGRKKKKLDKISLDSQPMRLRFMTHSDKITHVNYEASFHDPQWQNNTRQLWGSKENL